MLKTEALKNHGQRYYSVLTCVFSGPFGPAPAFYDASVDGRSRQTHRKAPRRVQDLKKTKKKTKKMTQEKNSVVSTRFIVLHKKQIIQIPL